MCLYLYLYVCVCDLQGETKRGMSLFFRYLTDYQLKRARLTN